MTTFYGPILLAAQQRGKVAVHSPFRPLDLEPSSDCDTNDGLHSSRKIAFLVKPSLFFGLES